MKNFRFKSIWLQSESEKRALAVEFSPTKTLIVGMNHTGKSSLIKSLFIALGAFPTGDLDRWNPDTVVLVAFSMAGNDYFVIRQYGHRALFAADGSLLFTSSNATDWGRKFAELNGYNLVLTDKSAHSVHGDARTFFLPYYINQDGSWLSNWNTFVGLQQYKQPVQAVLEFFTGVKPAEYYELNATKAERQSVLKDERGEQRILKSIKDRFAGTIPLDGPKTLPEVFLQDIARLTEEMTELNAAQESLKEALVRQKETAESIRLQVRMAEHALSHYKRDAEYLQEEPHDVLICPTCHAEHGKTFLDILKYTEDARVLQSLVHQLKEDDRKAREIFERSKAELRVLDEKYSRLSAVLDTRRGDRQLGDVIESMGAQSALVAFDAELDTIKGKIDGLLSEIDALDVKLNELTSAARSREILKLFRESYQEALRKLNMPAVDTQRMKLTSRPDVSGSGGPRSILAYHAALWQTSLGEHGDFSIPAVIDSPQQQGQDAANLPIMIDYIANSLPAGMQVILAVETATAFKFDKVIELKEPYHLLRTEEFEAVSNVVRPLMTRMYG